MDSEDNIAAESPAPHPEAQRRSWAVYNVYAQESSSRRAFVQRIQQIFKQIQDEAPLFAHPSFSPFPIETLYNLFAEAAAAQKFSDIARVANGRMGDHLSERETLLQTILTNISIIGGHPKRSIALALWKNLSQAQRAEITRLRGNMQAHMDDVGQLPQFEDNEHFYEYMDETIPIGDEVELLPRTQYSSWLKNNLTSRQYQHSVDVAADIPFPADIQSVPYYLLSHSPSQEKVRAFSDFIREAGLGFCHPGFHPDEIQERSLAEK